MCAYAVLEAEVRAKTERFHQALDKVERRLVSISKDTFEVGITLHEGTLRKTLQQVDDFKGHVKSISGVSVPIVIDPQGVDGARVSLNELKNQVKETKKQVEDAGSDLDRWRYEGHQKDKQAMEAAHEQALRMNAAHNKRIIAQEEATQKALAETRAKAARLFERAQINPANSTAQKILQLPKEDILEVTRRQIGFFQKNFSLNSEVQKYGLDITKLIAPAGGVDRAERTFENLTAAIAKAKEQAKQFDSEMKRLRGEIDASNKEAAKFAKTLDQSMSAVATRKVGAVGDVLRANIEKTKQAQEAQRRFEKEQEQRAKEAFREEMDRLEKKRRKVAQTQKEQYDLDKAHHQALKMNAEFDARRIAVEKSRVRETGRIGTPGVGLGRAEKLGLVDAKTVDEINSIEKSMRRAAVGTKEYSDAIGRALVLSKQLGAQGSEVSKQLSERLNKTAESAEEFRRRIGGINQAFSQLTNTVRRWLIGYLAVSGLIRVFDMLKRAIVDYNDTLKLSRDNFTAMLGSAQAADVLINKLEKLAARTPFSFQDLLPLASQLLQAGRAAQTLDVDLQAIADHVAQKNLGTQGLDRIIYALNQMHNAGRVTGNEMRQLNEAQVAGVPILAKAWGTNTAQMQKWITQGIVPADKAINALLAGMGEKAKGASERATKTIGGALNNMLDAFNKSVGGGFKKAYDEAVKFFLLVADIMQTPSFQKWAKLMGERIVFAFKIASDAAKLFAKTIVFLSPIILAALTAWTARVVYLGIIGIPNLVKAMQALFATGALASVGALWAGWAAAAVAALGVVYQFTKELSVSLAALWDLIRGNGKEGWGSGPLATQTMKDFDDFEAGIRKKMKGIKDALGLPNFDDWKNDVQKMKDEMAKASAELKMPHYGKDDLLNPDGNKMSKAMKFALQKQLEALNEAKREWEKYGSTVDGIIEKIRTFGDKSEAASIKAKLLKDGTADLSDTTLESAVGLAKIADQMKRLTELRSTVTSFFKDIELGLVSAGVPMDRFYEIVRQVDTVLGTSGKLRDLFKQAENKYQEIDLGVKGRIEVIEAKILRVEEIRSGIGSTSAASGDGTVAPAAIKTAVAVAKAVAPTMNKFGLIDPPKYPPSMTDGQKKMTNIVLDRMGLSSRGGSRGGSPRDLMVVPGIPGAVSREQYEGFVQTGKKAVEKTTKKAFSTEGVDFYTSLTAFNPASLGGVPAPGATNEGQRKASLLFATREFQALTSGMKKEELERLKTLFIRAGKEADIGKLLEEQRKLTEDAMKSTVDLERSESRRIGVMKAGSPALKDALEGQYRWLTQIELKDEEIGKLEEKRVSVWEKLQPILDLAVKLRAMGQHAPAAQLETQANANFLVQWESIITGFRAETIEDRIKMIGAQVSSLTEKMNEAADSAGEMWNKIMGEAKASLTDRLGNQMFGGLGSGMVGSITSLVRNFELQYQKNQDYKPYRERAEGRLGELESQRESLQITSRLSEIDKQRAQWAKEDGRRDLIKLPLLQEELEMRARILGVLQDINDIQFKHTMEDMNATIESLKYQEGTARAMFEAWRALQKNPNLTDPQRQQIFDQEKEIMRIRDMRDTWTEAFRLIADGAGKMSDGVSGAFASIADGLYRMAQQFIANEVFKYLLQAAGFGSTTFTGGFNGNGGVPFGGGYNPYASGHYSGLPGVGAGSVASSALNYGGVAGRGGGLMGGGMTVGTQNVTLAFPNVRNADDAQGVGGEVTRQLGATDSRRSAAQQQASVTVYGLKNQ